MSVTSLVATVYVYQPGNDYALYEVTRYGIDTVGVWGSNPHAPTNRISDLQSQGLFGAVFMNLSCDVVVSAACFFAN